MTTLNRKLSSKEIFSLQRKFNVHHLQQMILNGSVWSLEGSMGRFASYCLQYGVCLLPTVITFDAYNNPLPSRSQVKKGSSGSLDNARYFWNNIFKYPDSHHILWLEENFPLI